jgi:hypothetical protein
VGRRLAFDAQRGRLWVVCEVCRQWNLTPFEERWEAIESAERAFRGARLRSSTDQIGLARLSDGTELIRIGEPLRPEFAAWRYGARFAARWRIRGRVTLAAGGLLGLTKGFGAFVALQVAAVPTLALGALAGAARLVGRTFTATHVDLADGQRVRLAFAHVEGVRFRRDRESPDGWSMEVPHAPAKERRVGFRVTDPIAVLRGEVAQAAAARILPRLNRGGGHRRAVADAVSILERHGTASAVMRFAGQFSSPSEREDPTDPFYDEDLGSPRLRRSGLWMPVEVRLAAEMAVHEEVERRALEGELRALEATWREAEEVAAIADSLTLPAGVLRALDQLRLR